MALAPTSTMQRKNIQKPEAQNISNEKLCQVEYYDVLTWSRVDLSNQIKFRHLFSTFMP